MEKEVCSEDEQTELTTKENSSLPRKKKCENCKRFSDEQVKSLESTFRRGEKLEPRMKLQLAKDLGLQPRQVSIWFQNKRARWKSKHIEQEYRVLKASFDALYEQFESLKKENESLLDQLQGLRSLLENQNGRQRCRTNTCEEGIDKGPRNGDRNCDELQKQNEKASYFDEGGTCADQYLRHKEDPRIYSLLKQESSSLASPEDRCNLASDGFVDESCCPSSWWDF